MRKNFYYIIIALFLTSSYSGHAQFGKWKKKLKKVKKKVDKATKKSNSSVSNSSGDGKPESNDRDPVYRRYVKVKDRLKMAEYQVDGSSWDRDPQGAAAKAGNYMKEARKALDFLKEKGEDEKKYFKDFEARYAKLDTKVSGATSTATDMKFYSDGLNAYDSWTSSLTVGGLESLGLKASYEDFYKFRDDFRSKLPEEAKKRENVIKEVEDFFDKGIYDAILPNIKRNIDREIKHMNQKNGFGDVDYKLNPATYLAGLKKAVEDLPELEKLFFQDKSKVAPYLVEGKEKISMLSNYIDSGEAAAYKKKFEDKLLDGTFLGLPKMSNTKYENMAKAKQLKDGKIIRAIIISEDWNVKKKYWGYPIKQFIILSVANKRKDGKCYKEQGEIRKDYLGGGKYGNPYYVHHLTTDVEMRCKNVNINKFSKY